MLESVFKPTVCPVASADIVPILMSIVPILISIAAIIVHYSRQEVR